MENVNISIKRARISVSDKTAAIVFGIGMILAVIAPARIFAEVLLHVDFDNHPEGQYTDSMGRLDFPGAGWYNGLAEGRGTITPGRNGQGKALRMLYPAGSIGANPSAVQIRAKLSKGVDTAWASYWVMFEEGLDFVRGGKLPGLCGGTCVTGGNEADGFNGWSARVMWRGGGAAEQYVYHADNTGYGADLLFNKTPPKKRFIPGQWHRINTQIIMNTPGAANGVIRSWFDGELSLEEDKLLFRNIDALNIDLFYISTFFGGSDPSWAPGVDTYITFDDFLVVSKQESSPYPQALYELSATSGRVPFAVAADMSASLGSGLSWDIDFGQIQPLSTAAADTWVYDVPGIYDISARVRNAAAVSTTPGRKIFALGERGLTCDSLWQGMSVDTIKTAGDTLGMYLTIVDTAAIILAGPAITAALAGEYSFFGALRYGSGVFGALAGTNVYNEDTVKYGAGTYEIRFVFNSFSNPMTYNVSVSNELGRLLVSWENMPRRGYATSISAYGTWSSRDRAAVVHMEPFEKNSSGVKSRTHAGASKKLPSVKQRKGGILLSIPSPAPPSRIEIFSAKGALVKRVLTSGKAAAFIPLKSRGLYLYSIKSGGEVVRGRVIVR